MSGYWLGVATPFMIILGILLLWLAGSLFAALDWHLHGCWSGCSHVQYDEPPSILYERERFLTYDMLCEALARNGVLAPIRYEYL